MMSIVTKFKSWDVIHRARRIGVIPRVSFFSEAAYPSSSPDVTDIHPNIAELTNLANQKIRSDLPVRPKLRISDILAIKHGSLFTISEDASIDEAISHVVKQNVSCCLTLDSKGEVSGIFTARDILKFIHNANISNGSKNRGGQNSKIGATEMLSPPVSDITVKKEKLVYCSPDDTVRQCREIMFQLRIRNLPVLSNNELLGIVSIQDLADSAFSLSDTGGKKGFIHSVSGRKGLPEGTKLNADTKLHSTAGTVPGISIKYQVKLALDVASHALPHPFKHAGGVASSRRNYGPSDLQTDMAFCEDAHFTIKVPGPDPSQKLVYLCVADGVGSWRQYGVDPRNFSHRLVENAQKVVEADAENREELMKTASFFSAITSDFQSDEDPIHPLDVIIDAWNQTCREQISGSSTICVATLDNKLNQLSYSNLGDCGLIVMRHIDSETVGYMRERQTPRHLRKHDLRVAYLSQQQLRSFNLPYQLGYSGIPQHTGIFESPLDADTASISVMPGDIILMATDGLFDNLDLDEILLLVNNWEDKWFQEKDQTLGLPHPEGEAVLKRLAVEIVEKAREMSLDKNRDSPFALLAKENDIMWGGGMPDDTSVLVARVVKDVGSQDVPSS